MSYLRIILVGVLLLGVVAGWGQEIALSKDELADLKKLAEYNTHWNAFLNIWAFFGPLLAVLATYFGLRKKVDDWTEKEIVKKASEKFGVDWAIVKQLVDDKRRDAAIKTKRIAVLNNRGKYLELLHAIERSGFSTDDYRKFEILPVDLEINACDLVVIDNSNEAYNEDDVVSFFDLMKEKVKLVYLATVDLSSENFNKYRSTVKIIKLMDRLGDTIKLALT